MIYLKPEYGLGNRIRSIVSGIALSQKINKQLVIVWEKNNALNADFYKIFVHSSSIRVKKYNYFFKLLFYKGNSPLKRRLHKIVAFFFNVDFLFTDEHMQNYVWDFGGDIINIPLLELKNKKSLAIKTCHEFLFENKYLAELVPVQSIETKANLNINGNQNIVGIHIRRTDHVHSILKSPLELFIECIENEIKLDKNVKFYLSTDDEDIAQHLTELFNGYIIHHKKELRRNSELGITEAMTDLITLSKCTKIYGSYWSSFSFVAAAYGNIPLHIVSNE